MARHIEIVSFPHKTLLMACKEGLARAGYAPVISNRPTPGAEIHLSWGLGHPDGQRLIRDAKARGGHVIGLDVGYFDRRSSYRVTFDHDHPQAHVMRRELPPERWEKLGLALRSDCDPAGHILLVGTGHKTAATYGEPTGAWERRTGGGLVASLTGRRLVFRAKPGGRNPVAPPGFTLDASPNIETALRGCALAVCRNSNAAVDAVIAGVPFRCEDGAAMAIRDLQPLETAVRLQFLRNLAWFNYRADEFLQAATWTRIFELMENV